MRELDLLERIYQRSRDLGAGGSLVKVGPGDDCAVLAGAARPDGSPDDLLITVDHLIEGRHYFGPLLASAPGSPVQPGTPIDAAARKGVARSVSDIAAMGGTPRWSLGTVTFPPPFPHDHAEALCAAVAQHARAWGCPMVGGDIAGAPGPVVMTITVAGSPHPRRGAVLRSGARPGDAVWITGRVGGALASGRHLTFEPRVIEGQWLAGLALERHDPHAPSPLHAMIDVSDGLGLDAGRIAHASGVTLVLEAARLPLHEGVSDWRAGVGDGEDYELLFTCDPALDLPERVPGTGTLLTRIGTVREAGAPDLPAGPRALVLDERSALIDVTRAGWEHGVGSTREGAR